MTNLTEQIAAGVVGRHFPQLLDSTEQAFHWIEHYPRTQLQLRQRYPEYATVTFASCTPKVTYAFGNRGRVRLGTPQWSYIDRYELERLLAQQHNSTVEIGKEA